MTNEPEYHIVVLPDSQPAARHCTLGEALAFQRGYHEATGDGERCAVIGLETPAMAASATSRRARSIQPLRASAAPRSA